VDVHDKAKKRSRTLRPLWLASVSEGKLGQMCVALNADEEPSCSMDCTRIAYTSMGKAFVAELEWRPPNLREKLVLGMPLTETDEKELQETLSAQAKQIGLGMNMYSRTTRQAALGDSARDDLTPYLKNSDNFFLPGTDTNIFQFYDLPNLSQIENPAETIMGTMDAGRKWIVVVYADGHVRVMPR